MSSVRMRRMFGRSAAWTVTVPYNSNAQKKLVGDLVTGLDSAG